MTLIVTQKRNYHVQVFFPFSKSHLDYVNHGLLQCQCFVYFSCSDALISFVVVQCSVIFLAVLWY